VLANDEGTITTTGFDGVRRNYGSVRVPWTLARLAVSLDESVMHVMHQLMRGEGLPT
jgi:hypothetical protein